LPDHARDDHSDENRRAPSLGGGKPRARVRRGEADRLSAPRRSAQRAARLVSQLLGRGARPARLRSLGIRTLRAEQEKLRHAGRLGPRAGVDGHAPEARGPVSQGGVPARAAAAAPARNRLQVLEIVLHEGRPDFKSPPGGCDAHFHVFGPAGRYPYNQADLRYAPPLALVEDFLAIAKKLGTERFVFVQPSAYGRDNRCMLDAMREVGTQKCRGIADIDENAPDTELERLDALGVRGVRINV